MRIGLFTFPTSIDGFVADVEMGIDEGFSSFWLPQIFGIDALTAISIAAREIPDVTFGTSVIPTYPRHPMALAQQALTTQAATDGRLTLGIGLSHQVVIEGMYGMSFDKPAIHMRDYLDVLLPLVRTGKVNHVGKTLTGKGQLGIDGSSPFPVMIAAMAPRMLELAGSIADGTILWMTGPRTTADYIIPTMAAAAAKAGRSTPATMMGLPVCVTTDVDAAKERAAKDYLIYGQLPSYRAMLDREGAAGPADIAIIGNEAKVRSDVERLVDSGATEFAVSPFGSAEECAATRALLGSMAAEAQPEGAVGPGEHRSKAEERSPNVRAGATS